MTLEIIFAGNVSVMTGSPREELTRFFGKVCSAKYDFGNPKLFEKGLTGIVHTSTIPHLYRMDSALSADEQLARVEKGHQLLYTAVPIQGLGRTEEQSIQALYNDAAEAAMQNGLRLLVPHEAQEELPVVVGKNYEQVRNADPRHDHSSPDIANFIVINYHPLFSFIRGGFNSGERHSHFWLG